jgi:hypothetical protein
LSSKLILDQDAINEHDFEGSRILGITAPIKNYQFCILLNQYMGFEFRFNPDHEIALKRKNRTYYFSMYEGNESNTSIQHFVYHNQFDGEYLLPELKHMDFIWWIRGEWIEDEKVNDILQTIRGMKGVQLVVELTPEHIKNKGNLIFE